VRYFSTFSGIGGFELGIERAYDAKQRARELQDNDLNDSERSGSELPMASQPLCVGYSEIDKHAERVYAKHFPGVRNYGDITQIDARSLPDFDVLVGGFPCQAFSVAGKRKGFLDETRGTLFFDIARILEHKRPRYIVLENVKGLLSHDAGRTFATIVATLDELGYDLQWQVLNSKDFGVPQNRERIYIVGHIRGESRPQVFPIIRPIQEASADGGGDEATIPVQAVDRLEKSQNGRRFKEPGDPSFTITTQDRHGIMQLNNPTHSKNRVYDEQGIAPTLNTMQGGGRQPKITRTIRIGGRQAPHGCRQNWDSYEIDGTIRRLTPLECERLQGFPDGWTTQGLERSKCAPGMECSIETMEIVETSETQRYKMCGNAVTVNVVEEVIRRIIETI
jgi:DNA (cytosine-5)-methyltransferase 1